MAGRVDPAPLDDETTVVRSGNAVVLRHDDVDPPRRRPLQDPASWLLLLVILVVGGLAALWVFSRTDTKDVPDVVGLPDVVGKQRGDAEGELTTAGFRIRVVDVFSDQPEGSVIAQNPEGSEEVARGSR